VRNIKVFIIGALPAKQHL